MKKILSILLIITLTFCACEDVGHQSSSESSFEDQQERLLESVENDESIEGEYPQYDVVRVVDGDTIVIDYNGKNEKVRLIGVDTPESVHPDPDANRNSDDGIMTSEFTKNQLEGKKVGIEFDVQELEKLVYLKLNNALCLDAFPFLHRLLYRLLISRFLQLEIL